MVVSNSSPLHYLIAVGHADLLPKLFQKVLIPPAVYNELTHPAGRRDVRLWIQTPPEWLSICDLQSRPPTSFTSKLDPGECEALQLGLEIQPDFVVIDEKQARRIAVSLGVPVIGALGILREAFLQNLILDPLYILGAMTRTGFRLSPKLLSAFQLEVQTINSGKS